MLKKVRRTGPVKKPEKKQLSRGEKQAITAKGFGKEPVVVTTDNERGHALNWYSSVCEADQARKFLIDYLEAQERTDEVKRLARVSDNWIPRTAAWIARMISNGNDVAMSSIEFLERGIDGALKKAKVVETQEVDKVRIYRERIGETIAEVEKLVDEYVDFDVLAWYKLRSVKRDHAAAVSAYYEPVLLEIIDALEATDSQVSEGYGRYRTDWLLKRFDLMEKIVVKSLEFSKIGARAV